MITDLKSFLFVSVSSLLAGFIGHYIPVCFMNGYRDRLYKLNFITREDIKTIGGKLDHEEAKFITKTLGIIERIIYAGGWLMGYPQIIPVILALKVTPSLKDKPNNAPLGWTLFNMYLVGNLLSLISAIVIAELCKLAYQNLFFCHCCSCCKF